MYIQANPFQSKFIYIANLHIYMKRLKENWINTLKQLHDSAKCKCRYLVLLV